MHPAHQQRSYSVRFDWGLTGASAIAADADVAVVVDVLSFTTTLSVAIDRGIDVFPYRWRDDGARQFAADRDAVLAVGRREARGTDVSLSPVTIQSAEGIERLVLPSPEVAAAAWNSISHSAALKLEACASGRELILDGYPSDVAIAAEVNGSRSVPVLRSDRFENHEDVP